MNNGMNFLSVFAQRIRQKLHFYYRRQIRLFQLQWKGPSLTDSMLLKSIDERFSSIDLYKNYISQKNFLALGPQSIETDQLVQAILSITSDAGEQTINAADKVCSHSFDLLGSGPTNLGPKINWHSDFKSGHQFNFNSYFMDFRPAPYPGGYDIKVPWELSRCQHFTWLGQAYWFSKSEKYAQEFVDQVTDWIKTNPWPHGVNWASTMDVAIRLVNWLWGYRLFAESPTLTPSVRLTFHKSMLIHGRHIYENLEKHGEVVGNHYLSNLAALAYLGILCPEFNESRLWRDFALSEMEQEIKRQVYPDGVNFEASTCYHRLVLEIFLSVTILAQNVGHRFSRSYLTTLEKMVEVVMYLSQPDGRTPQIGDNDNGRFHRLRIWDDSEREWADFRYILAVGATMFNREDFAVVASQEWHEALWLIGQKAVDSMSLCSTRTYKLKSRSFTHSGFYILREYDKHLTINAGPNGQNGYGGHAHNGLLGITLHSDGQDWLVDPGTYLYTYDYGARNRFRSTKYHNTVTIDDKEQVPFTQNARDIFRLPDLAKPKLLKWVTKDEYDLFSAEHYGYLRLKPSAVHRRTVFFDKLSGVWLMHDELISKAHYSCSSTLHLAPDLYVQTGSNNVAQIHSCKHDEMHLFMIPLEGYQSAAVINSSEFSSSYGTKCESVQLSWNWQQGTSEAILALCVEQYEAKSIKRTLQAYELYKQVVLL